MQFDHGFFGFPTGQDGVDAARRPGQLVLQHGVGAGAGLPHTVLDVGQRAHGELQAIGEIGAVAVAQCHAATHDVMAEPFQGVSVHAVIMTDKGGNVESPCPFLSIRRRDSGSYFLGTPARSARTWVTASQKISSTFSLDRPTTSTFGTPVSSRRTTVASGSASPVHHSWRMAKSSNRSPSSVCRSALRRLATGIRAHHSARQYGPS